MQTHIHRIRRAAATSALAVAGALAVLAPSVAVAAKAKPKTVKCNSADLRYPFMPGGPKTFGVFNLKITAGTCATAHHVAKDWMTKFEAAIKAGRLKLPRLIDGFTFKNLPAHAAQTFTEQGTKRATTIRFDYRVPNG